MPFVGLDWRSPGDMWIKTASGWERAKLVRLRLFENLSENLIERVMARSNSDSALFEHSVLPTVANRSWWNEESKYSARQPRILMPQTTKENHCRPGLCDAVTYLEMKAAIGDIRRYDYVVGVIDTLINDRLTTLSGASQKMLFELVRKMVTIVLRTHYNVALARRVLNQFEKRLSEVRYTQIGTQRSWSDRCAELQKMKADLAALKFGDNDLQQELPTTKGHRRPAKSELDENDDECEAGKQRRSVSKRSRCDSLAEEKDKQRVSLLDLPTECTLKIVRCLATEADMMNLGRIPSRLFRILVLDEKLWRDLCFFRYTEGQVDVAVRSSQLDKAATVGRTRSVSECGPTGNTLQLACVGGNREAEAEEQQQLEEPECSVLSVSTMRKRLANLRWYRVFRTLQRTCTPRTVYPSGMLVHCFRCNFIYWNCVGHPCVSPANEHDSERKAPSDESTLQMPLSPERFVQIFI